MSTPSQPLQPDTVDPDVAAQAVHLRRLSERLDQLTVEHTELRQDTDRIADIAADLQRMLERPAAQAGTEAPPSWPAMTVEEATHAWEALADWVDGVLVPWYALTRDQLPDCWALHRPVVVELSWLHNSHRAAYEPGAGPHQAAEWHTHWKPAALQRIRDAIPRRGHRTCSPGHHLATDSERTPQPGLAPFSRPTAPTNVLTPPTEQPAGRAHWNKFYERAVADDLVGRSR